MSRPCQWTSSGVSVSLRTFDGDGLALLHAEDGAGGGAVVADGGEDAVGGELDGDGRDAEGDVGSGGGGWMSAGGTGEHDHLSGYALAAAAATVSGAGLKFAAVQRTARKGFDGLERR